MRSTSTLIHESGGEAELVFDWIPSPCGRFLSPTLVAVQPDFFCPQDAVDALTQPRSEPGPSDSTDLPF